MIKTYFARKVVKEFRCWIRNKRFRNSLSSVDISVDRLMVIAPHPDDETIGAGGLIAMQRARSLPVSVVFLTKGEASHLSCCGIDSAIVAARRQEQAKKAMAWWGVNKEALYWLGLPDSGIPNDKHPAFKKTVEDLAGIIIQESPDAIFCTHPNDGWLDHTNAAQLVKTVSQQKGLKAKIYWYYIWAAFNLNHEKWKIFCHQPWGSLDISPVSESKMVALSAYFNDSPHTCGVPFAGRLPKMLLRMAKYNSECFLSW